MTEPKRPSLTHLASHLDWLSVAIVFIPWALLAAWEHAWPLLLVIPLMLMLAACDGHYRWQTCRKGT